MNLLEKTLRILEQPACDNCLGRQFGQLLSGFTNNERGKLLRTIAAMSIDNEDYKGAADMSNFHDYAFHNLEIKAKTARKQCSVCGDIFARLEKHAEKIAKNRQYEYKTFLIGTRLSSGLIEKEEALWERVGIDYCEPLKAEINREIGKLAEAATKTRFSRKNPDVNMIVNFGSGKIEITPNPIFIYGEYQKLKRGIPQTKWPSKKYRTSVEEIIAKPFMLATRGRGHKLHGMGREDIDARCLAWRPFVLEITGPKRRETAMKKLAGKIGKEVKVRNLRPSNIEEVRRIKEARTDKTYRAVVKCNKPISKDDLEEIKSIVGEISQRTPQRVLHRRADLRRKRHVKQIKYKYMDKRTFMIEVRGEAGLYIKELISGDSGRTRPSISELLKNECTCKELDVMKIHVKG
ncbi:MAG: tRNA pseudouridine(54/55) synthase Pus10 [Candidatus Aenigmarchaeota archaeon]|nr:tRNA pseudouridine(54/55) synthase Pus10 [Candidatus Aenigmarchaeota archaeon]